MIDEPQKLKNFTLKDDIAFSLTKPQKQFLYLTFSTRFQGQDQKALIMVLLQMEMMPLTVCEECGRTNFEHIKGCNVGLLVMQILLMKNAINQ